ncbi:MAG: hypothetical protein Q8747_01160 [Candidatus Phytoplasma australasiaticum]|uniref:Uncharacterized protein n=3 Tax=16SrII (Peanut WB group) TaxID=85621 RepID=A0A9K3WS73_9MOLU|nr:MULTISPECIES: hypothetical protein [Phytoplasma]MCG3566796.1 hypothetical protein [Sesame phyllody phytoplasma]MDO8031533.1 hypothetical protein [Candidatus Phytoplasma australasiaticum]MDO8046701.1 hypothetical protein [Candidatus Phytoplasma australasiaticum]MDO8053217.1 hypothetical protein [Candidatus Phytoplasma australasiaticum]MDO8053642.1 hypothetical protein [Candidatus Phytoplasma australasiaticum]
MDFLSVYCIIYFCCDYDNYFTNNSIKLRYKDIGVLRAIGAGKIYILSIF